MQESHCKEPLSYPPATYWENSMLSNSNVQGSSSSLTDNTNTLSSAMETMSTHFTWMKQTNFQSQDHPDSTSTQSTGGKSYGEVASLTEPKHHYGHCIVTHLPGDKENMENPSGSHSELILSKASQHLLVPLLIEAASWPLHGTETPHFNGFLPFPYATQHMAHHPLSLLSM